MWSNLRKASFHVHNSKKHFFHQIMPVHIFLQSSQVLVLKVAHAAFAVACFWGLRDIHEGTNVLQIAPSPLDKQTAGCDSPHDWLMSLAMHLAALCDIQTWKWHQWMLFGCFQSRSSLYSPLWLPTCSPTSYPEGVLVVLAMPVKNYLKWSAIQLAIHSIVDE